MKYFTGFPCVIDEKVKIMQQKSENIAIMWSPLNYANHKSVESKFNSVPCDEMIRFVCL